MARNHKKLISRAIWQVRATIRYTNPKKNMETDGEYEGNDYPCLMRLAYFPLLSMAFLWCYTDIVKFQYLFLVCFIEFMNYKARQERTSRQKQLAQGLARVPTMAELLESAEFEEEKEFLREIVPQLQTSHFLCLYFEVTTYFFVYFLVLQITGAPYFVTHSMSSIVLRGFGNTIHPHTQFVTPYPSVLAILAQLAVYFYDYVTSDLSCSVRFMPLEYLVFAILLAVIETVLTMKHKYLYNADRAVRGSVRAKFFEMLREETNAL